jgi:hypothetical protein
MSLSGGGDTGCRLAWVDDRFGDQVDNPKACDEEAAIFWALLFGWSFLFAFTWVVTGLWRCLGPWLQSMWEDFDRFEPPAGLA